MKIEITNVIQTSSEDGVYRFYDVTFKKTTGFFRKKIETYTKKLYKKHRDGSFFLASFNSFDEDWLPVEEYYALDLWDNLQLALLEDKMRKEAKEKAKCAYEQTKTGSTDE